MVQTCAGNVWKKLKCEKKDLQLLYTLMGGQCFRWKKTAENEYTGVFANRVWILSQDDDFLLYKVVEQESDSDESIKKENDSRNAKFSKGVIGDKEHELNSKELECERLLSQYFRLEIPLQDYYEKWAESDPHFKSAASKFYGVRIMDQDPLENLFSFICSSNNHISRISSMVEKLCSLYGKVIATIDGVTYHSFPSSMRLADPSVEGTLKNSGFGYRAKYIHKSACMIEEFGGLEWLENLKTLPYVTSKTELMKLVGVGAKVADCICLMSLGHLQAIPVDTHIFQIASQLYLPHLKKCKSVTDKIYNEIGDHFRKLYGIYAGWAHTILFCSDLKMFQEKNASDESPATKTKRRKVK